MHRGERGRTRPRVRAGKEPPPGRVMGPGAGRVMGPGAGREQGRVAEREPEQARSRDGGTVM
jgi:hypothetical protein